MTGLAVTYPFGGVFWDYIQYPAGLRLLGHDVIYLEDPIRWCYDPKQQTFVEDGSDNAACFAANIARFDSDLAGRWFYRDARGETFGLDPKQTEAFCRSADLFLNLSASSVMRDEYRAPARAALLDSDPIYTQAGIISDLAAVDDEGASRRLEQLRHSQVFFTFAENIGNKECRVPDCGLDWKPTRQPVLVDRLAKQSVPLGERRPMLTTVASWEPSEKGPVVDGIAYAGKSTEFEKFIDMPAHSSMQLELAMSGPAPVERLRARGWNIIDAFEVSSDPWRYCDYLASSSGEWSVAKNAYVASRSGWFSCRSACYLALGVPVVAQDTGFSRLIPCGEGLFAFSNIDEAAAAIDEIALNPARHARAAMDLARTFFDSQQVLSSLLERAFAKSS